MNKQVDYLRECLEDSKNKIYIFTDSDLDGTGCRTVFEYFFDKKGIKPKLIFQSKIGKIESQYEEKFNETFDQFINRLDKNSIVIFSDITPPQEKVPVILSKAHLFIFDHHPEFMEETASKYPIEGYFYDKEISSCMNVYLNMQRVFSDFEINKCLGEFVELVDVYDCFRFKHDKFWDAFGLHNILFSMIRKVPWSGYKDFVSKQLKKFDILTNFQFLPREKQIVDEEMKALEEDISKAKKTFKLRTDSRGNKYGYIKHYRKISVISNILLQENPDLKYMIINNSFVKNERKMSARSIDFYVRDIANKYGGEGHTNAAGFIMSEEEFQAFDSGEKEII